MNNYTLKDIFPNAREEAEVNTLLNNDVYKFMMLDFILTQPEYRDIVVKWKMTIRSKWIQTANVIPKEELIKQLELTKNIKWITQDEAEYLECLKLSSWRAMFRNETIDFLKTFELTSYTIWIDENNNYELEFTWPWTNSMMWEIFGLKIINSLYLENYIKKDGLDNEWINHIINETIKRLYEDIRIFKENPEVKFLEFWTRRAASTDFQRKVFDILIKELPHQCLWTSNMMLAKEKWLTPRWTNAHELRMVTTALHDEPQKIIDTMYDIDRKWAKHYPELAILLPDTYGTTFYYDNCPQDIFESHTWTRFDSKDPMIATPEYVNWILKRWWNPMEKIWIPSDWLDAQLAANLHNSQKEKIGNFTPAIGTNFSNNTKWTYPKHETFWPFGSFSVVIKPAYIQRPDWTWVSCVKLSDNPEKAVWDKQRVDLFKNIFWVAWVQKQEVLV